jgi:hypothetical protein
VVGALLAVGFASTGCGTPGASHDGGPGGDGTCVVGGVEVGSSGGRFIALPRSGGELPIVRGSQGGIHVLVGFRPRAMPLTVTATYRLVDEATGELLGEPVVRALGPGLYRVDAEGPARIDDLLVLDPDEPRVADFSGREGSLEVLVVTPTGDCARDTRRVTLR